MEIARRLRAEQIYSRIVSGSMSAAQICELAPRGIILSGEAASSNGVFDACILELGIPVLALGHAAHMLLAAQGGACADAAISKRKANIEYGESLLFDGLTNRIFMTDSSKINSSRYDHAFLRDHIGFSITIIYTFRTEVCENK